MRSFIAGGNLEIAKYEVCSGSPGASERAAHVFTLVVYLGILAQTHSHVARSLAGMTQCKWHV